MFETFNVAALCMVPTPLAVLFEAAAQRRGGSDAGAGVDVSMLTGLVVDAGEAATRVSADVCVCAIIVGWLMRAALHVVWAVRIMSDVQHMHPAGCPQQPDAPFWELPTMPVANICKDDKDHGIFYVHAPCTPWHRCVMGLLQGTSCCKAGVHACEGFLWRVSVEGFCEGFLWRVSVKGFCGGFLWRVSCPFAAQASKGGLAGPECQMV
eukprot:8863-Chlamydomonas_euryale.AAC.4